MSDLIDRQQAIDAILAVTGNSSVRELYEHVQEHGLSEMWSGGVNAAIDIIIALPSAQAEERTEERAETHACDLIDRQAAIDVIDKIFPADPMRNDYTQGITCGAALATEYIKQLPSAQSEEDCKSCKHGDLKDSRCDDCRVGCMNYPSYYERKTYE